jgi:signal peptidase I
MNTKKIKIISKKIWHFLIHEESLASFIVDAILIVLIGKFVLYPIIGLALGTSFPIVAVVSSSMDHRGLDFNEWWENNENYYEDFDIIDSDFESFYLKDGFKKGDIFIVKGTPFEDLQVGDIIVYQIEVQKDPIIHRIVLLEDNTLQTKGDANPAQIHFENSVAPQQVHGKAVFRLPFLGWVKVLFVELVNIFK